MVGKVNVGKSNLFEVLFPKGSGDRAPVYAELQKEQQKQFKSQDSQTHNGEDILAEDRLLPPAQPESRYPVLPIVSSLPGTTASPIRLPFGKHKGELIDLPGIDRGDLESYVKDEHKLDLVMTYRNKVDQHTIRAGQSLILGGGLVRITPELNRDDPSMTMQAYPFIPLKAHVTSTEKAVAQQLQERESGIKNILAENAGPQMASAGMLELMTDVTKRQAGSLLRAGVSMARLPFRVYATDILIEGVGWVELVCQVRRQAVSQPASPIMAQGEDEISKQDPQSTRDGLSDAGFAPFANKPQLTTEKTFQFPKIEVFSPKGKHISQRPCLEAWQRWNAGLQGKNVDKSKRPRQAMKSR